MKFEIGHFYKYSAGRCIAIVGEVETYKWGKQFVVEEVDKTGHGISCTDADSECNENWLEIGREEFLRNFKQGGANEKIISNRNC